MDLNRYFTIKIKTANGAPLVTSKDEIILTASGQQLLMSQNLTLVSEDDFGISAGSMNLEEIICDDELTFGKICSNKFEVEIFNSINIDFTSCPIEVTCTNTLDQAVTPIFKGKIESSTKDDYSPSRTLTAYDDLYFIRDNNVATWWNDYWDSLNSTTSTLKEIRNSLCNYVGLEYVDITLPNDDLLVSNYNYFTKVTFADIMKMIGEAQACFPHMSREGKLEFIQLAEAPQELTNYDRNTPLYEDYTTITPDGVDIYDSSDNLSVRLNETASNAYPISGNIFLLSLATNLELLSACSNIFNEINDITYTPATVSMIVSNLDLHLGDKITTYGGTHFIMSQTYSGALLVDQEIKCVAYGESLNQEPSTSNDSIIEGKRYASLQVSIEGINSQVGTINSTIGGLRGEMTTIAQTASDVTIETFKQTDTYYKGLQTNFNFSAEDGLIISGSTQGAKNDTQLQLTTNGVFIEDSSGTEITSMQKNTFKTGEWVLQQINDNKVFNIFRERK
jgi:hypothetical protein